MRVFILDDQHEISDRAARVLPPMGVAVSLVESVSSLKRVLGDAVESDLLIVNVHHGLLAWRIAEHIRAAGFEGRTLAFVDHLAHPDSACLMQLPRAECRVRPSSVSQLDAVLRAMVGPTARSRGSLVDGQATGVTSGLIGRSTAMLEIFKRVQKVAAGDANVCIYGESGTGKELIARAIHYASARREGPLVALDCTAIPEGLMEAQLFGHVKGAFTGAVEHHDGFFSRANAGTLFIDELCELSLPLQAKLLRVIQTREYFKVGGNKPIRTNIRLITATNRDPKQEVHRGNFREDLYYRVTVVTIRVPPLRERKTDIPLLAEHFVKKFSAAYNKPFLGIASDALEQLVAAPWPGNVRQLENFLEQAVVLAEGDVLTVRDLFPEGESTPGSAGPAVTMEQGLVLSEVERRYILEVLRLTGGNRRETARRLGISVRTLQYRLKQYSRAGHTIIGTGRPVTDSRMTA